MFLRLYVRHAILSPVLLIHLNIIKVIHKSQTHTHTHDVPKSGSVSKNVCSPPPAFANDDDRERQRQKKKIKWEKIQELVFILMKKRSCFFFCWLEIIWFQVKAKLNENYKEHGIHHQTITITIEEKWKLVSQREWTKRKTAWKRKGIANGSACEIAACRRRWQLIDQPKEKHKLLFCVCVLGIYRNEFLYSLPLNEKRRAVADFT